MPPVPPIRRSWFQFGLRGLFVFIAILTVPLGFLARWHDRAIRQRDAVAAMKTDTFDHVHYKTEEGNSEQPPPVSGWLGHFFGVDHFAKVVRVDFGHATDEQLRHLRDLPDLEELWFTFDSKCSPLALREISLLKNIRVLRLDAIPAIDDQTLAVIGSLKELERLTIECGDKVTDAGLAELGELSHLESLSLDCGPQITDHGLSKLRPLSQLKALHVNLDEKSNRTLVYLPGVGGLSVPLMLPEPLRGGDLAFLDTLSQLESLWIEGGAILNDDAYSRVGKLTALTSLTLTTDAGLTDDALLHLSALTELSDLHLDCKHGAETDVGLANLARLTKLEMIQLRLGDNVSDQGLAHLAELPSLRYLSLDLNDRVMGDGLAKFGLQTLYLDFEPRSKDAPSFRFSPLTGIVELNILNGSCLVDDDLLGLANLRVLRSLTLKNCNRLTNDGLDHLKQMTHLEELEFEWCQGITDEGIAKLRIALPNCSIGLDGF